MKTAFATATAALLLVIDTASAMGQSVTRVYTKFDSKQCRHTRGVGAEDYGSWRCTGHDGIEVKLSAGDQRMQVSFGRDAAREPAARQTFPTFNHVYEGTVEWRLESRPNGKPHPFATILRWNVKREGDERDSTGRVLVVTRLARAAYATWAMSMAAPTPMPISWRKRSPMSMRAVSSAARTNLSWPARYRQV